jgi:hypothetical protein
LPIVSNRLILQKKGEARAMSETVKITPRNQITLPATVGKSRGAAPGIRADFIRTAAGKNPGDFSDHLIGTINKHHGCRTTLTFDKAAAQSPQFSELQR